MSPLRLLYVNNAQLSADVLEQLTKNILSGQCEVQEAHMSFTPHAVSLMLGRDADTNKVGAMTASMIQKGELLCSTVSRLCDAVDITSNTVAGNILKIHSIELGELPQAVYDFCVKNSSYYAASVSATGSSVRTQQQRHAYQVAMLTLKKMLTVHKVLNIESVDNIQHWIQQQSFSYHRPSMSSLLNYDDDDDSASSDDDHDDRRPNREGEDVNVSFISSVPTVDSTIVDMSITFQSHHQASLAPVEAHPDTTTASSSSPPMVDRYSKQQQLSVEKTIEEAKQSSPNSGMKASSGMKTAPPPRHPSSSRLSRAASITPTPITPSLSKTAIVNVRDKSKSPMRTSSSSSNRSANTATAATSTSAATATAGRMQKDSNNSSTISSRGQQEGKPVKSKSSSALQDSKEEGLKQKVFLEQLVESLSSVESEFISLVGGTQQHQQLLPIPLDYSTTQPLPSSSSSFISSREQYLKLRSERSVSVSSCC